MPVVNGNSTISVSGPRNPDTAPAEGHYGLHGMIERAEMMGADLEIESTPGGGTRVRLQVESRCPFDEGAKTQEGEAT